MSGHPVSQGAFTAALLSPDLPVPEGLSNPDGGPATKRFDVYRNNVIVSLTDALKTGFPVTLKLLGETFFTAMAGVYVRQHPPQSPLMMFYGAEMPGFLEGFEPVGKLGYLPDIARLELALREAYHAADAAPLDPAALQALDPEQLVASRPRLAPAVRVLRSRWPIHALWRFNMAEGAPKPQMASEDVLISRAEFDPEITRLAPGAAAFFESLAQDASLGDAVDAATAEATDFDLTTTLGIALSSGALTELRAP
ncbi:MAG: DNA-binding domain-containing protein [Alphaproteobacteria bacterium]|nr:DNA-binding domain-containing protein [Alphaproteobacteria bacterium]NNF24042.1 DUF2063 domain-containing protein [Paracoccaceae bacterium]